MTVLPGSLDYLYYNGVLDHIPTELYTPIAPAHNRMCAGYADYSGAYNNNCYDEFCPSYINEREPENKNVNFKHKLLNFLGSNTFKGLLGAGIIGLTLTCLIKKCFKH